MKQEMKKISTLSYHDIEVNYFCNNEGYAAFYTEARSCSLLIDISDRKTGEIIRLHRKRVDIGINNEKIQTFHTNNHAGKATFGTASWEIDYELKDDKTVYTVRYYVEEQQETKPIIEKIEKEDNKNKKHTYRIFASNKVVEEIEKEELPLLDKNGYTYGTVYRETNKLTGEVKETAVGHASMEISAMFPAYHETMRAAKKPKSKEEFNEIMEKITVLKTEFHELIKETLSDEETLKLANMVSELYKEIDRAAKSYPEDIENSKAKLIKHVRAITSTDIYDDEYFDCYYEDYDDDEFVDSLAYDICDNVRQVKELLTEAKLYSCW